MEKVELAKIVDSNNNEQIITAEQVNDRVVVRCGSDEVVIMRESELTSIESAYNVVCAMYNTSAWQFEDLYA